MDPRMRKRPSQVRSRTTVTSILEAADRILRADGYDAASTNRVARVAGFSVGSLYQYFRDKQAIVGALIDREMTAEAELARELIERAAARTPRELAEAVFGELVARRAARAHLYRTLDAHAAELCDGSVLDHVVSAQASTLSDALQRVSAQLLPRSARSIDARVFVLSRTALSAAFGLAVDAPAGVTAASLAAAYAAAVELYVDGKPPSASAVTLALSWAKPMGGGQLGAEVRGRRRREARGVLLGAGVDAQRLEPAVLLLASIAEVAQATAQPPYGTAQEDLLHEVARFAEALGV